MLSLRAVAAGSCASDGLLHITCEQLGRCIRAGRVLLLVRFPAGGEAKDRAVEGLVLGVVYDHVAAIHTCTNSVVPARSNDSNDEVNTFM